MNNNNNYDKYNNITNKCLSFDYEIVPPKQVYRKRIQKYLEMRDEYDFQQLNKKISKITQNIKNVKK